MKNPMQQPTQKLKVANEGNKNEEWKIWNWNQLFWNIQPKSVESNSEI